MEDEVRSLEHRFLSVPEAARLLRINRGRAYEMAANGTLPGVIRIGRTIRVDKERLIAGLRGEHHFPARPQGRTKERRLGRDE